jgi:hypothetical protein
MVPSQPNPQDPKVEWSPHRLQGSDGLALRASKKLVQDEALLTKLGPARLKLVLDGALWPSANHIGTRQLWEYLASYLYLPRLRDVRVLEETIRAGIGQLVCDHFAYAGRYDEAAGRYEGLTLTGGGSVVIDTLSVLVKPEVAKAQQDAEQPAVAVAATEAVGSVSPGGAPVAQPEGIQPKPADVLPRRFFATVELSQDRAARDMGRVTEEVLQHLTTLPGARVRITVEIDATVPAGVAEPVQRVVHENCQTLKFKAHGFETT